MHGRQTASVENLSALLILAHHRWKKSPDKMLSGQGGSIEVTLGAGAAVSLGTYDDVIEDLDFHQLAGSDQVAGDLDVGL